MLHSRLNQAVHVWLSCIYMSAETREFTPAQQGFQRLLLRDHKDQSLPGEGAKRLGLNFSILVGATAADLVEGNLVDNFLREPLKQRAEAKLKIADGYKDTQYQKDKEQAVKMEIKNFPTYEKQLEKVYEKARLAEGWHDAVEFAEEWASDWTYSSMANGWVRLMTGVDDAKYVSETAAFLGDWGNVISQVFFEDYLFGKKDPSDPKNKTPKRIPLIKNKDGKAIFSLNLAYPSMDFVNAVNVEAALRLIEEVPVLGDGVAWAHEQTDKLLDTPAGRWLNTFASKGILGFHIGKNVIGKNIKPHIAPVAE